MKRSRYADEGGQVWSGQLEVAGIEGVNTFGSGLASTAHQQGVVDDATGETPGRGGLKYFNVLVSSQGDALDAGRYDSRSGDCLSRSKLLGPRKAGQGCIDFAECMRRTG